MKSILAVLFVLFIWLIIIFLPIALGLFVESFNTSGDVYNQGMEKLKHSILLWLKGVGLLVTITCLLAGIAYSAWGIYQFSSFLYNLIV